MGVTINSVKLPKSVQIYKKKSELSKTKINDIFKKVSENKKGYYVINKIKEVYSQCPNTFFSIMSFKFEEQPSFLVNTDENELKYAYICIVENENYIFISKKNITGIEKELNDYIDYFDYEKFSCFKGDDSTKYEKVSMGNMTISDSVIRARSYEASNLNGIMPMSSSSRSVPKNIRLNHSGDIFSITPNTSRIGQRSTKSNIDEYISWCISISSEITRETTSKFINEFAKPITLEKIIKENNSKPIGILFHFHELEEKIENGESLYILEEDTLRILDDKKIEKLFNRLKRIYDIKHNETEQKFAITNRNKLFAELKINDKSVSIREPVYNNIYLDNQKEESILDFINNNKNYTIVFDKPEYSYIGKYAFSDEQLLRETNINKILSIFVTEHTLLDLGDIESEKCKPTKKKSESRDEFDTRMAAFNLLTRFPQESLFYRVEENFNEGILICDDMGNEWADHINITDNKISFIHSKFTKKDTYGASAMHEVVSQALKNIGRVHASIEEYEDNYNSKWNQTYESTNIPRTTKNGSRVVDFDEIREPLEKIYSNPNSRRQIFLATPFFSKIEMTTKLSNLVGNDSPNSHHIQLIWLLSSFITSCQDYGIEPYILCKE